MQYAYGLIQSLSTPGGTMGFNAVTGDTRYVDPDKSDGLSMKKVRANVYDRAQISGYYFGNFLLEGRHIVLGGLYLIRSVGTDPGILAAREAMIANDVACLTSISEGGGDGTLTFADASTLTVKCDVELHPTGAMLKSFVFGLVSAS